MKFWEVAEIIQMRYGLSLLATIVYTYELKSDLMAFKTKKELIAFLDNLEKAAREEKESQREILDSHKRRQEDKHL